MNKDEIKGKWQEIKGELKKQWGQLTDDDLKQLEGDYDKVAGRITQARGIKREELENKINDLIEKNTNTNKNINR